MFRQTIVGLAVSTLLLLLAARNVRLAEIAPVLQQASLSYLALAAALSILAIWLRAYRWRYLIPRSESMKTANLFTATMIGFMGNNVLPLRVGDLARAYIAAKKEHVTVTAMLATVIIERLLDVFAILTMLSVLFFQISFPRWINSGFLVMLTLAVLFWLGLLLMNNQAAMVSGWFCRLLPRAHAKRLAGVLESFFEGLAAMKSKKRLLLAILLSVPIWCAYALAVYVALHACRIDVPFAASWVVLAFVGIGVSLPSAPGFVGTYQFFTVAALTLFSVDQQRAFGFSLLQHLSQYIPVTFFGWLLLIKEQMSLGDLVAFRNKR
ncbi:MAG: flippase-like domain-containing protein [Deltaproteobacteria bacterium]|nr:MAG: flippase-like domain-containing protein [Deltaproteobacteria bacterium]